MKATRRILSLLLALTLVLGLALTVVADDDPNHQVETIKYEGTGNTLQNEKPGQISIANAQIGRTYNLYKIFDVTFDKDAEGKDDFTKPIYWAKTGDDVAEYDGATINVTKIDPNNAATAGYENWFEFIPDTSNTGHNYRVNAVLKEDPQNPGKQIPVLNDKLFNQGGSFNGTTVTMGKFQTWAQKVAGNALISGGPTATGTSTASANNTLTFTGLPYGYYLVTVSPITGQTDGNDTAENFQALISVDTTNDTIIDKNDDPHWTEEYGKKIQDNEDADAPSGSYGIDEIIPYSVGVSTSHFISKTNPSTNEEERLFIYKYYLYDSINEYMSYVGTPEVVIDGTTITSAGIEYNYFAAPYEEIEAWLATHPGATWEQVRAAFPAPTKLSDARSFRVDIPWADPADKLPAGKTVEEYYTSLYRNGAKLVINYEAKLDGEKIQAGITKGDITWKDLENLSYENKAYVSNYTQKDDPNTFQPTDPKEVAPEQAAKNYTVDMILYKVDEKGEKITESVKFKLTGTGEQQTRVVKDTFTEDANGTYWKLKSGNYTLDDPAATWQGTDATQPYYTTDPAQVGEYVFDRDKYDDLAKKYKREAVVSIEKITGATAVELNTTDDAEYKVTFGSLGAGDYDLVETLTPDGYNSIADKKIRIVFHDPEADSYVAGTPIFEGYEIVLINGEWKKDDNGIQFTYTPGTETTYKMQGDKLVVDKQGTPAKLSADVVNKKGGELPATGGIGTTIFYVVGSVLLVGAAVVLYSRKRMTVEDNH